MLRKSMAVTALISMVALSACNHITGPRTGQHTSFASEDPAPQPPPRDFQKTCLSDNRSIHITAPAEGTLLYGGDRVLVTWQITEVCGHYTAEVEASLDNGRSFYLVGEYRDALSATWSIPSTGGAQVMLRVTIHDGVGDMSEEISFNNRLISRPVGRNPYPQQYE